MHLHLKSAALMLALLASVGCATTQSNQAADPTAAEQVAATGEAKADCCKDGMCAHAKDGEAKADCCKGGMCAHQAKDGEAKAGCCGKDGTCANPECVKSECCKKGTCGKADCCKKAACQDGKCPHHAQDGAAKADCCGKDGTCKHPECVKSECCKKGMCGKADCCKKAACKDGRCPHHAQKAGTHHGHAGKMGAGAAFSGPPASLVSFPNPAASSKALDMNLIVDDPSLAVAIVTLRNGTRLPEHVRPFPVTIQAHSGSGTVTAGEQTFELAAGQVVVLAPHVPHMIQPKGKEPMVLVVHQLRAGATPAQDQGAAAEGSDQTPHAH
jgi:quercetin dioxygenase-like cupin family protein